MKIIAGCYQLEAKIGSGGEARVFRARDLVLGIEVAIRLPLRPASAQRTVPPPEQSPGWVRLLTCGHDETHGPFQVFELLSGKTLRALVEETPLRAAAWRSLVHESLDAVGAVHAAGWVHGDLNANNFILTSDARWKLLELPFHSFAPPETRSTLFGSIQTLAPEQIDGASPSPLTDLYSLGCLYYYAASGTYPNAGGAVADIAVDRLRFPAAPLAGKASGLTGRETGWVMRLLEREPRNRPDGIVAAHRLLEEMARPIPSENSSL
jgi:serine/threonine protein kinase